MSRPVPQISTGRLVSLSVDNPKNYVLNTATQSHHYQNTQAEMNRSTNNDDSEEKTMLWKNVATLFMKCEQNEDNLKDNVSTLTRGSDEMYQELQDVKAELAQVQTDITENNVLSKHVRKLRKYVNKKCEKVREDISYGSSCADHEIFDYIDTLRDEFNTRLQKMEKENTELREELSELHKTYDQDYETFVQRENDLMSKLDTAIRTTEGLNERLKDHEEIYMKQLYDIRSDTEERIYYAVGDMREEFARAISREVQMESKETTEMVQNVNNEMTELVTRSNQYHSHRYFGMVEEVKQVREMCETLKKSIGMVDSELSDTKETVDFLKDEVAQSSNDVYDLKEHVGSLKEDIYNEMDRDYYDIKGYVRHKINQHKKKDHAVAVALAVAAEVAMESSSPDAANVVAVDIPAPTEVPDAVPEEREQIIFINDDDFMTSDNEEDEVRHT